MRKVVVLTFVTLDGVMQAPGGPEEDTSGNFTLGGWSVGYWDDFLEKVMSEQILGLCYNSTSHFAYFSKLSIGLAD